MTLTGCAGSEHQLITHLISQSSQCHSKAKLTEPTTHWQMHRFIPQDAPHKINYQSPLRYTVMYDQATIFIACFCGQFMKLNFAPSLSRLNECTTFSIHDIRDGVVLNANYKNQQQYEHGTGRLFHAYHINGSEECFSGAGEMEVHSSNLFAWKCSALQKSK